MYWIFFPNLISLKNQPILFTLDTPLELSLELGVEVLETAELDGLCGLDGRLRVTAQKGRHSPAVAGSKLTTGRNYAALLTIAYE